MATAKRKVTPGTKGATPPPKSVPTPDAPVQTVSLRYQLKSIEVQRFACGMPTGGLDEHDEFAVTMQWQAHPDLDANHIVLVFAIQCHPERPPAELLYYLVVQYTFAFESLATLPVHEGMMIVPNEVLYTLLNVAYATTRGILFERLAGTGVPNVPLPMISVEELAAMRFTPPAAPAKHAKKPAQRRRTPKKP